MAGDGGRGASSASIWAALIAATASIIAALIASGAFKSSPAPPIPEPTPTLTASPTPTPDASGSSAAPTPIPVPTPEQIPLAASPSLDLSGEWTDGDGLTVELRQSGGGVELQQQLPTPMGVVTVYGQGFVQGRTLTWDYTSNVGVSGRCQVAIAGSGTRMQGTCQNNNGLVTGMLLTRG